MQEKIKERDAKLHDMIEQARVRPERSWRVKSKPLIRIDLRESCVLLNSSRVTPGISPGNTTNGVLLTPIDGATGDQRLESWACQMSKGGCIEIACSS